MIKILFSDFDGTMYLHDENGDYIPEKNLKALQKFRESGCHFVITTGRPQGVFLQLSEGMGLGSDYICANGSISVYDDGTRIVRFINADKAREVFEIVRDNIDPRKFCYYTDDGRTVLYEHNDDYIDTFAENDSHISSITLITHTHHDLDLCERLIRERFGDEVTFSPPEAILADITEKGVNKGRTIEEFCEHYGISREETAGIGDGRNDLAIFAAVNLRFAMNDGSEELKKAADYCVDSAAEAIVMIMKRNEEEA